MFASINKKIALAADFSPSYGSLATVGYTIYNGDGTTFQVRTTTGVVETVAANGQYRVELASTIFTAAFDGYVVWDTGGASPVYAIEDIFISDRLDVAVSSRADGATYTSVRAAKLDNLDAAVSGVSASVWAAGTRTLTGFGTLVSDTAAAVWAAATRTLSSAPRAED